MNSIDLMLLDLVQIAETPVYSAHRWQNRQLGRESSMAEFFRALARLVEEDVVRLWAVDSTTHERVRWSEVPSDLDQRYARVPDLDDSFDPFGLSLTLGPAADLDASPDWEVDIDFNDRRFQVTAKPGAIEGARQQIRRLFPDLEFVEADTSLGGDRVVIAGSVHERRADAGGGS
ncbi:MAG: hypothetical protein QOJ97_1909 [Solirubrobacteraceae bacterium]|jgi:hypothetical protein|nr:hypothetical protein [Solirubrobacteraceae bacterium]